ncbi:MAG: beta-galactosidase trimerization domain-containing protein [Planctomycetes bacterium]|nr:beta-galactosidase trimerization domain-containing protein [Planctomycetota bacterium]
MTIIRLSLCLAASLTVVPIASAEEIAPTVVIAEGESFTAAAGSGWMATHQDDSYASHTYGGMWVMNGGLLGAAPDSAGAVATTTVQVPTAGAYRVWSKYQAPPYFNFTHRIEVIQGGKTVHAHDYGKIDAPRMWSFSAGLHRQLWWSWGLDHDAAEAPAAMATLAAGPAEIRISTIANPQPAGDRFIDFVVLTTEPGDTYRGFKPYGVGSPFMLEAMAASRVYLRFKNSGPAPARLTASTAGHMQPLYGGQSGTFPDGDVAPGQWSGWFNIATICRLAHDEGVTLNLPGAADIEVEVARDPEGKELRGQATVPNGEALILPIDIAWNPKARAQSNRAHARQVIADAKGTWRRANGGKKPALIPFYGAFNGPAWSHELKDALGYNTVLPDAYPQLEIDGYHQHKVGKEAITAYAATLTPEQRQRMRILSFGDEIHIGGIDYNDPANTPKFQAWLAQRGLGAAELGVASDQATLTKQAGSRLTWWAKLFEEQQVFATFAASTKVAEETLHPKVLTGANYSPHSLPQYYGPIHQWIDLFRHRGMSAFWTEDYIFSTPESPQMIGWMLATARCGTKYHDLPIHFYVMPHAPGQTPGNLRRSMLYAIGAGADHIDNFWVGPAEYFTENFVDWSHPESFKVLSESIHDTGEVEAIAHGGKPRVATVAVLLSKATDFNEGRVAVDGQKDPFVSQCTNEPSRLVQTIGRKDAQLLYLAARQAGVDVDLITEDDIAELDALKQYAVVYAAGEWIESRATAKLDAWVQAGGTLYASAGLGARNEHDEANPAYLKILGLAETSLVKDTWCLRPLLELPLAKPIDTMTVDGALIPAVAFKQVLKPTSATVLGTWSDGAPAATMHAYGAGKAYAIGTAAGHACYKTALRVVPFARGGRKSIYTPIITDPAAVSLVRLPLAGLVPEVTTGDASIEALLLENTGGTLLTLVNWSDQPRKDLKVSVRLAAAPKSARSVSGQREIAVTYADGIASFSIDLTEADYIVLAK